MKRFLGLYLCAAALAACGDAHLSEGYGRRTRAALDAQTAARVEGSGAIDGEDAKLILQRHRGLTKDTPPQPRAGAIIVPTLTSGSGSSSSMGRDVPAAGSIRLDATR